MELRFNWKESVQDALNGEAGAIEFIYNQSSYLCEQVMRRFTISENQYESILISSYQKLFDQLSRGCDSQALPHLLKCACLEYCGLAIDAPVSRTSEEIEYSEDYYTSAKRILLESMTGRQQAALFISHDGGSVSDIAETLHISREEAAETLESAQRLLVWNAERAGKAGKKLMIGTPAAVLGWLLAGIDSSPASVIPSVACKVVVSGVLKGGIASGTVAAGSGSAAGSAASGGAAGASGGAHAAAGGTAAASGGSHAASGGAAAASGGAHAASGGAAGTAKTAAAHAGVKVFLGTTVGKAAVGTAVGVIAAAGITGGVVYHNHVVKEEKKAPVIAESTVDTIVVTTTPTATPAPDEETVCSYNWLIQPEIEADDMFLVRQKGENKSGGYYYNSCSQFENEYTVIKKGEALDLIDQDGSLVTDWNLKSVREYYYYEVEFINPEDLTGEIDVINNPQFDTQNVSRAFFFGDSSDYPYGNVEHGDAGWTEFYYSYNDHLYNCYATLQDQTDIPTPELIGAPQSDQMYDMSDQTFYSNIAHNFAVFADGVRQTEYIYDAVGGAEGGLMAVSKNGKWGYVDASGNEVIPIEYDASWGYCLQDGTGNEKSTVLDTDTAYSSDFRNACYAPSDGYINLVKDGKWELRNTDGELCIAPGTFEQILPVYDGKCWVKKDGKWGLIEIVNNSGDGNDAGIQDALDAYEDYLNTLQHKKFSLGYVDEDDVPELFIIPDMTDHMTGVDVYSYVNGEVLNITTVGSNCAMTYKDHGNLMESEFTASGHTGDVFVSIDTSTGTSSEVISFEYNHIAQSFEAKINGNAVSEEEYDSTFNSYNDMMDQGVNSSKMYDVTSANIQSVFASYS